MLLAASLWFIAGFQSARSQPATGKSSYAAIVNAFVKQKGFSGSVLVAESGRVIFSMYAGMSNRQHKIPVTANSIFRICSVTKTFTAVIILQLMEEGKIDLKNTIGTYYPEYTGPARDSVNIHQLLTYSSGIENIDQGSETMYALQLPVDTIIKNYCSGRLVTVPGSRMNYKNAEYIILGKIIEKITGEPYQKALEERILKPLAMRHSGYLRNRDIVPGIVTSYLADSTGAYYNDDPYWIENFYSSGAIYATAEDLYRFDQALFNGKLLKKETLELMITSYPQLWGVAYSFWVNEQQFGNTKTKVMDRRGSIGGNNTAWYHFIKENKTIIVFSNSNAADVVAIREKLASALFR
jgi:CubicO group peptidase (beta-lactamase class C family)